jgi:hypothetical protein
LLFCSVIYLRVFCVPGLAVEIGCNVGGCDGAAAAAADDDGGGGEAEYDVLYDNK